jgi:hypothetical protein
MKVSGVVTVKIKLNENNNRVNITRPAWPTSEFSKDLKAMYGEFLEPGEEDKEAYEQAKEYLLESNKKYEAEQVVKAYASGGWRKALSVIADLGIAGTAGLFGLAMFGLYTWGGPITASAIGFGLLHALLVGTYGEVIKALLLGADNVLRRNPKMTKLYAIAQKDQQASELINNIKKEMDKKEPEKSILKSLKKDLEKRLKELEKGHANLKEDATMKYVLEGNLFDNIRAKRERIAKGSGEKVAKPGDEDYPENLKKIAKEAAVNEALAMPKKGEEKDDFISRFMGSEQAKIDFPDHKQRVAVAFSQLKRAKKLNEELFRVELLNQGDEVSEEVVEADSEDEAITKTIDSFDVDVENINNIEKLNEADRNAPHVIKGKYIRLDNGQVIEPEPDYWDDYVGPLNPDTVIKDPADNDDNYEVDEKGQLRFKLKESQSLLSKYGVEGYNKPKRTPGHKTKSHLVVAKKGDKIKVVRFGAQGVKGSPKKDGESEAYRKRRQGFVARHKAQNPGGMKDKFSALYWANKVKW